MSLNRKIIVTLTTIPSRFKNIFSTIESLKTQSMYIDEIVLSVPFKSIREPSKNYIITKDIKKMIKKYNVTLYRPSKDYGPATKLFGLLERELPKKLDKDKEPLIITVDDDKIYHHDTIKVLVEGYKRNPKSVVARKGCILTRNNYSNIKDTIIEEVYKGSSLKKDISIDFVLGTGGVLYRTSYFNDTIFDLNIIVKNFDKQKYFFIDDVYISKWLDLYNINKRVVYFDTNKIIQKYEQESITKNNLDTDNVNRHINPLININKGKIKSIMDALDYFDNLKKITIK